MYCNARWYDPSLGRFAQADSIVPPGVQGLDRYAYVNNSPMNYVDPSGHVTCEGANWDDGPKCTQKAGFWQKAIKDTYDWDADPDYSLDDLKTIYQTGRNIEKYVDDLTGGNGLAWMNEYLGGTTITRWEGDNYQTWPGWLVGENTIYISQGDIDRRWLSHELGHIWDINTGESSIFGSVNGVGDWLNEAIGGSISGTLNFRFLNYYGKSADPHIPGSMNIAGITVDPRFLSSVANGYGNGSTADYLAETFSWNVMNPDNAPSFASAWVDSMIIAQSLP